MTAGNTSVFAGYIFSGHEKRAKIMLLQEKLKPTKMFVLKPLTGVQTLAFDISEFMSSLSLTIISF